jgi:hypothetical protein
MAILIRTKTGETFKGHDIWEPNSQKIAIEFDKYIQKEIKRIEKEVYSLGYKKKGVNKKDARCHHWIGGQLKKITNHNSLHKLDKRWVINSIEYHAPYPKSSLSGKNRSKNRIVYEYDLLMNEIPESKIDMMKWGEWSHIFDTHAFHTDHRSMAWFKDNLESFGSFNDKRDATREFVKYLNKDFCSTNRDLSYLTDEQFSQEINTVYDVFLKNNPKI